MTSLAPEGPRTLIDELLSEQRTLTAVDRFSRLHEQNGVPAQEKFYRDLIPLARPVPGEQYAFIVELDKCSGCKACVSACHSLNGLDEEEMWRSVGLLVGGDGFQQHVTTACHHCVDPGCLNGCPVLAYEKDAVTGIVRHLDDQCMGCSYCVMKCPYEVPKYSPRRGIVRKCDMCAERLAECEAPACVQACPSEAIRIEIVEQQSLRRASGRTEGSPLNQNGYMENAFPPDSPDPRITLPSTRYISRRTLPHNILAADHGVPRLESPHWPLVFMLVLTQAAAGIFLSAAVAGLFGAGVKLRRLEFAGFGLCSAGLAASIFHLGQPLKAWRAFLGWRKSWLSREIIALSLFAGVAALSVVVTTCAPLAALMGLGAVLASAMVYVDTRRPFWGPRLSFGSFYGTTVVLGPSFAAALFGWTGAARASIALSIFAALTIQTVLFCWRQMELDVALSDPRNPLHANARVIDELLPWTVTACAWLYVAAMAFGAVAIVNAFGLAAWWATFVALAGLTSEIIARYVFFVAGRAPRMPGGVPT